MSPVEQGRVESAGLQPQPRLHGDRELRNMTRFVRTIRYNPWHTALHCSALYCTTLCCTTLHCTALHYCCSSDHSVWQTQNSTADYSAFCRLLLFLLLSTVAIIWCSRPLFRYCQFLSRDEPCTILVSYSLRHTELQLCPPELLLPMFEKQLNWLLQYLKKAAWNLCNSDLRTLLTWEHYWKILGVTLLFVMIGRHTHFVK